MKKSISMLMLAVMLFANSAWALDVNLRWDANTETDLAGYKVYYSPNDATAPFVGTGATEGAAPIDVGLLTTATVSGLNPTLDYYFAVTAYNTSGLESSYSNVVSVIANPTVTASATAGGSISPPGTIVFASGASQLYTITPNVCYRSNVFVDGAAFGPLSSYTFSSLSNNHTINATFALIPFTINASAGSGGTISSAGYSVASCGASPVFTITPDSGFHIVDVVDNGVSKGAVSSLTIPNIAANHTVTATFATTVVIGASAGGTATKLGTNFVPFGGSIECIFTPSTGYFVSSVLLNGSPIAIANNKFTLAAITGPQEVNANFESFASLKNLLWSQPGVASVWKVDSSGTVISYKNYTAAGWTAVSYILSTDGFAYLTWINTTGTACVWKVDANGIMLSYKLYNAPGWTATSYVLAPDGFYYLTWKNTSGVASVWKIDSNGVVLTYNNYTAPGWTATWFK